MGFLDKIPIVGDILQGPQDTGGRAADALNPNQLKSNLGILGGSELGQLEQALAPLLGGGQGNSAILNQLLAQNNQSFLNAGNAFGNTIARSGLTGSGLDAGGNAALSLARGQGVNQATGQAAQLGGQAGQDLFSSFLQLLNQSIGAAGGQAAALQQPRSPSFLGGLLGAGAAGLAGNASFGSGFGGGGGGGGGGLPSTPILPFGFRGG